MFQRDRLALRVEFTRFAVCSGCFRIKIVFVGCRLDLLSSLSTERDTYCEVATYASKGITVPHKEKQALTVMFLQDLARVSMRSG